MKQISKDELQRLLYESKEYTIEVNTYPSLASRVTRNERVKLPKTEENCMRMWTGQDLWW